MRRKINVQLISISIIAIISTMLVMLFVFYDLFQTQVQDDLSANAIVLKNTGIFHSGNEKAIHMDYRELRVTWISSDGTVLYDNDADVGTMDNHMSRPEVKNAFKRGDGSAVRQSATMGTNTFYYAIKLNDGSVLRVAREASNIWTVGGKIFPIIAATILVMMILCIILAHFMTKNLVKPIEQMAVDINDFSITPAYKELAPFAATIRAQHADILKSAGPLLFTGLMSSGVGYTLQILGQKDTPPAVASLIMSLESVFAALSGWLVLGQSMNGRELLGCVLVFAAVILAQIPLETLKKKKAVKKTA